MTTTTGLLTAEEFFEWVQRPENAGRHFELESGEVVEVSGPGELHGTVCSNVDFVLGSYIRRRRRGHVVANDTGILWERDPDTVRGPDIFFHDERPRLSDLNPRYSDHIPILVVEVVSPNDKMSRITRRVTQFLRWGVKLVWVIHPQEQTVTVYLADRAPEVLERNDELTGGTILSDFRCRVEEFFYTTGDEPASG